jgi:transposase
MSARRLGRDEIMSIKVLHERRRSNRGIARDLGITEGAVRYQRRRGFPPEERPDGRRDKPSLASPLSAQIDALVRHAEENRNREEPVRPANILLVWEELKASHGYAGSYQSVRRFIRKRYPAPPRRPYRRVEMPPGTQAQVDWKETVRVRFHDGLRTLNAFVMVLAWSRAVGLVWSERRDQSSWHACHNAAFRRLGGIPATARIDNLKTGMGWGAGIHGEVNRSYAAYARALEFVVDPCPVRHPEAKGKVESRIGHLEWLFQSLSRMSFGSLEELQAWTDAELATWASRAGCPATGTTVAEAHLLERSALRPLPASLPEPFDVVAERKVSWDCTIRFEGRIYSVPFHLAGRTVEVRGCAGTVEVWHDGALAVRHPRGTPERILIDPACYEGEARDGRLPPLPPGRLAQRILDLAAQPVQMRATDYYAALVAGRKEVA